MANTFPIVNRAMHRAWSLALMLALVDFLGSVAMATPQNTSIEAAAARLPHIATNDNRNAAGMLRDGVLTIALEIREGLWYPEADDGPSMPMLAFAEQGHTPEVPGPQLRVPAGTEIRATIRNLLEKATANVYGLYSRPGGVNAPLEIPAGEVREVRFKLTDPGTYYYWGTTTGRPLVRRLGVDSQLSGALIVDPPGETAADRVFVIGLWFDLGVPGDPSRQWQLISVINGKAWPYTERLNYQVGQLVRWRWINPSFSEHPLHMHGSYFQVDNEGDGNRDFALAEEKRRQAVTETVPVGATRSLMWIPEREGRWLFHCHFLAHMTSEYRYTQPETFQPIMRMHSDGNAIGMGGLVLGITVLSGSKAQDAARPDAVQARKLTLFVRERAASEGSPRAEVFQLQEGSQAPPLDKATVPGPPIVLTQGEPVEITISNQLHESTSVHWHGIELGSYYDGTPGWGGLGTEVTPPIEPGKTFVAKFTPPRAGTFIYHTHWHNYLQLTGGLYGPLIVLRPGEKFDPETDRPVVLSLGGPSDVKSPVFVNGSAQPEPFHLKLGVKYRLRLINIAPNLSLQVSLLAGAAPMRWRPIAKDGADLPPSQAIEKEAVQFISVGESYDFEFQPTKVGDYVLQVERVFNGTLAVAGVQVR